MSPPPRVTREPPTIAVVTPSFEMAGFLRETIDSVLSQDWPHVDYLVMDGGSRDGTRELLEGYGDRLRWISAPDDGQADAVNRGFERARGGILGFLNADDVYRPGALRVVAEEFERNPNAAVVYGDADYVDADGATVRRYPVADFDPGRLQRECFICQPAAFVERTAWREPGGLDPRLNYALDYDLWIRMAFRGAHFTRIPATLATSRMHADNKTLGQRAALYRESVEVVRRHYGYVPMTWLEQYARHLADGVDQFYAHSLPSRRSRALALALGARYDWRHPRRLWSDWQTDGCTHRFRDGWMSKAHRSTHEIPRDARRLVVAGRHQAAVRRPLLLTVSAAGERVGRVTVRRHGPFERSLPAPAALRGTTCEVTVRSAWTWRPDNEQGDTRRLSCLLDRVAFE